VAPAQQHATPVAGRCTRAARRRASAVALLLGALLCGATGLARASSAPGTESTRTIVLSGTTWRGTFAADGAHLEHAEGPGLPWLPGRGNTLAGPEPTDVAAYLESRARGFLADNRSAFALDGFTLRRDDARTHAMGSPPSLWLVVFEVLLGDLPIHDAEVRFVVRHGNLVSVLRDAPPPPAAASAARTAAAPGFTPPPRLELRDGRVLDDPRWGEGTLALRHDGTGYEPVWEGTVTDGPSGEPFQVVLATATGVVLRASPLRVQAQAVGGVLLRSPSEPQTMVPLANLEVANASDDAVTDAAGRYDLAGEVAGHLSGPYVRITDACGASTVDATGDLLDFGATVAGDCASPVPGAPGNTTAARTSMYHLNRMRDLYKALDPVTPWLDTAVDVLANHPFDCVNYYDAADDLIVLNWQASSTHCANAGQNPALLYHEWAHAYQWNQKGFFADGGTREGYADVSAFLQLPSSCPFDGFYLDANESHGCSGGRPLDYTLLSPPVPARPDTIGAPPYSCPTMPPGGGGVANYQSHCEAAIPSQAAYELALAMQETYGVATGMRRLLEMWIAAGPLQASAWRIVDPGPPLRGDGCDPRSWYRTLRVANDDDGNLLNGVPDERALFEAFDRHGIACGTLEDLPPDHATCPALAAPLATLAYDAASDGVLVQWQPVDGAAAYRVARSELGPDGPFTPIATVAAEQREHFDPDGTARQVHWYVVSALGAGGCASPIESVLPSSTCATAATLTAPADGAMVSGGAVALAWTRVPNAAAYEVALGPPGALDVVGTTPDESSTVAAERLELGVTYHWRVATHAADEACASVESATRSFTIAGAAPLPAVTSVTPDVASSAGGTEVRIAGSNLFLGAEVWFGSDAATVLEHASSAEIVVRAPAAAPGPIAIRIVNPGGGEVTWTDFAYLVGEIDQPLLENGAVEKLDGNGVRPPGWTREGSVRPALACPTLPSRHVHGGACSVRFRGAVVGNGKKARGVLAQQLDVVPPPRPPRLRLRFFARAKNVPANARARVFVDLNAAGALAERFTVRVDPGSYAFRAHDATFTPSVAYDSVSLRILYKAASGRVWIDDVQLEYADGP